VAQQMRVGFHRAQIVDRHDLDVGPARFDDRPKHVAPDPAEAVDSYLDSHVILSNRWFRAQGNAQYGGGLQSAAGNAADKADERVPRPGAETGVPAPRGSAPETDQLDQRERLPAQKQRQV